MPIEQILFDLGGVLYEIDPPRTARAFEAMGIEGVTNRFAVIQQHPIFDQLETGQLEVDEFYDELRNLAGADLAEPALREAWNALLLDFWPDRIALLQHLAQQMPVYLLSNTNEIHLAHIHPQVEAAGGGEALDTLFRQAFYSCRLGVRKPAPAAFTAVLAETSIQPETTLFVDDSIQNIDTARQLGFQTCHFSPGPNLAEALVASGLPSDLLP